MAAHTIYMKLSLFMMDGVKGTYIAYLGVFLTSIGLSTSQTGLITGIRLIPGFLCAPAWGALVDHTGRRRLIMCILMIGSLLTLFPLPWIASFSETKLNKQSNCSSRNNTESPPFEDMECNENSNDLFWIMLIVLSVSTCFDQPAHALIDSVVVSVVQGMKKSVNYGQQKAFGSIGFALGNVLAGIAADNYTNASLSSYSAIFFVFLSFLLGAFPFFFKVIDQVEGQIKNNRENESKENEIEAIQTASRFHALQLVAKTCTKMDNFIFLFTVFLQGIMSANMFIFLFVFMEKELDATKTNMGLSMGVAATSEIAVFASSPVLFRLFRGKIPCLIIGVSSYFVQFILISFVNNPWLILPIRLNHAIGFGLFWVASIEQTNIISPKEITFMMFGLLNGLFYSLGGCVGTIGGGALYDRFGARVFFRGLAACSFAWTVFLLLYFYVGMRFVNKCFRSPEEDEEQHEKKEQNTSEVVVNDNAL